MLMNGHGGTHVSLAPRSRGYNRIAVILPEWVGRTWNMEGEKDRDRDTRVQERQKQEESQ